MHVGNATGYHAGRQEVGRCRTRGESEASLAYRRGSTIKGFIPGLETQDRCHQKSKKGVSVTPQKGLVSSKNFKKIKNFRLCFRRVNEFLTKQRLKTKHLI